MPKTILILALVSSAQTPASALDPARMSMVERDRVVCVQNAGKNDATTERLAKNMEAFFTDIPKQMRIGQANFPKVAHWMACLTRNSSVGGDEELGYAASLCDTFADSWRFRAYLRRQSPIDRELREFRAWLLPYSRNVGVDCR